MRYKGLSNGDDSKLTYDMVQFDILRSRCALQYKHVELYNFGHVLLYHVHTSVNKRTTLTSQARWGIGLECKLWFLVVFRQGIWDHLGDYLLNMNVISKLCPSRMLLNTLPTVTIHPRLDIGDQLDNL